MFQPDFEHDSTRSSSRRVGKLAYVVGDAAEMRAIAPYGDSDHARQPNADEENKWLSERLMACYND
jgi:hypothetical protein